MRGLILAAGCGSRMGAATRDRPEGMLSLGGRPLIAWQLEALRAVGVEEVAIVRGHRGDTLSFALTYFENPRWASTSSASSLACAEAWLAAGTTIVSYADIVYPAEALRSLLADTADLALVYSTRWLELWQRRFEDPLSDAQTLRVDPAGILQEIGRRPVSLEQVRAQFMGLFALTPRGAADLLARWRALAPRDRDRCDMTTLFDRLVRAGTVIRAAPYDGWWCEIDSPEDLLLAQALVEARSAS